MTITDTINTNEVDTSAGVDTLARPGKLLALTAVTFAAGTAGTLWGAHNRNEIAIVMGALIVTTTLIYGVLLPRKLRRPNARVAMIVSAVAGASVVPAFWSALPLLLGVAGVILGYAAVEGRPEASHGDRGDGHRRTGQRSATSSSTSMGSIRLGLT